MITLRALAEGPADSQTKEPAAQVVAEQGQQSKPADMDTLIVRGRVLDPDGSTVAGAKLYLHTTNLGDEGYAVRATSGDNGRFWFTVAKSGLTGRGYPVQ